MGLHPRGMRRLPGAVALLLGAALLLFPSTAAAKTAGGLTSPYGNDISYPQCGTTFPAPTFGLVGVDDGIANKVNPCLGPYGTGGATTSELYWVSKLPGNSSQPKPALYVNTADPGNSYNGAPIADWPSSDNTGLTNPYGTCSPASGSTSGANSTACAWVYGVDMASLDASPSATFTTDASQSFLTSASGAVSVSGTASSYNWWLDVETQNTWQSSSADGGTGLAMNAAVLEGMVQYLKSLGVGTVGIYASSSSWQTITGGQSTVESNWTAAGNPGHSPLYAVPDWVPGARRQSGAISNCTSLGSFTGGTTIALAQWVQSSLDYDESC